MHRDDSHKTMLNYRYFLPKQKSREREAVFVDWSRRVSMRISTLGYSVIVATKIGRL